MAAVATYHEQHDTGSEAASTTLAEVRAPDAASLTGAEALDRAAWTRTAVANQRIRGVQAQVASAQKAAAAKRAHAAAVRAAAGRAAAREQERRVAAAQVEHDRAERASRARASRSQRRTTLGASRTSSRLVAGTTSSRSSDAGRGALAEAPEHEGKPYVWGATGPDSFDCSGFTQYLFGHQGTPLPRTAEDQYQASTKVDKDAKQPGDLIFTYDDGGIFHVGVYAGNGTMWAAPKSGDHVRRQTMWSESYYVGRFT